MIKYTDKSMTRLYDSCEEVIENNVLEVLEHFNTLFCKDYIDVQHHKIKRLTNACNGIGVYEVEIKTIEDKYPNLKEDLTIVDDSSLKLITNIHVGQECDVEVKPTGLYTGNKPDYKVGDIVRITNVDRTIFDNLLIGRPVKIVKMYDDMLEVNVLHIEPPLNISAQRSNIEPHTFKAGDTVKVLNTEGRKLGNLVKDMIGMVEQINNTVRVDIGGYEIDYFNKEQLALYRE